MKEKIVLLLSLLSLATASLAAEEGSGQRYRVYGFVRNYFYTDSRETFSVLGDMYDVAPLDRKLNELGEDLNAEPHSRMLAITTRLGVDINGPDILGGKSDGRIECDFAGFSTTTYMLRLRHAYFRTKWDRQSLLVGQTWHPMCPRGEPEVIAFAMGSPFSCGGRQAQIQYNYRFGKNRYWSVTAASLWQLQYKSPGPEGESYTYQRSGMIPEFFLGIDYERNGFSIGTGVDFLYIEPRQHGEWEYTHGGVTDTITRKVNEHVSSFTPFAYVAYKKGKFSMEIKSFLGSNAAQLSLISGYGVTKVKDNGSREYKPLHCSSSFINFAYGKKVKVNLFLGYHKNLGIDGHLHDFSTSGTPSYTLYMRGGLTNMDQMYRIAPNITYNIAHFTLGLEYEYNVAAYGTVKSDATVTNCHNVVNHHVLGMVKYSF